MEAPSHKRLRRLTLALLITVLSAIALVCIHPYFHRPPREQPVLVPTNLEDPHALLAEANRLYRVFNTAKAGPLYTRAEELFRESGDARNELYAKVGRIRCYAETQSFVDISNGFARDLKTPLVESDRRLKLWILAAKGMTDIETNPAAAKKDWEEARRLALSLGENQWAARAKGELGLIAFLDGDGVKAGWLVGGALLSAMASGDVGGQIRYLELIGNGFNELQRREEALLFFNRAIRVAANSPDAGFPFMAYEGKGEALIALDRREEAQSALEKGLNTARAQEKHGHETQCLTLLGKLAMQNGNLTQAIGYLEQAGATARRLNFYRMVADAMLELAKIYRQQGELRKAEDRLAVGLDASELVGDRYYIPRNLTALAELKVQEGDICSANSFYGRAEDIIDGLVIDMPGAYSKSSLIGAMSETYLRHFELTAKTNNVGRAFEILERARGRTIADILQSRASRKTPDPPGSAALASQISTLQLRLMRSESPDERQDLLESLEEAEVRRVHLGESVEDKGQALFTRPAALVSVQEILKPDELLLEYVLDEPNSFCIAVSRTEARLISLPAGRGPIEHLTGRYLGEIESKKAGDEVARQLYSLLVAPVPNRSGNERLIIVPDGKLHSLPFDSLRDPGGRYVLASSVVAISPSATVLHVLRTKPHKHEPRQTLLAVGAVPYQTGPKILAEMASSPNLPGKIMRGLFDMAGIHLENLPESEEEVQEVARELGPENSTVLTGEAATESRFKSEPLNDFKILHLAVHAIPSTRYPERAALVLGRDPSSGEDGLLQEREIAGLSLNADLVTLSACHTAVGKLEGEEGVTSLAHAFLVAGGKAVVASLWSVQDDYTTELMEQFYHHLAEGQDKAAALRQAKMDFMKKHGDSMLPSYWAGFVIVGDGSSAIALERR
jgi:CHAT domain-containing protein